MHALETIHSALRPQGLLLDIRPAPQHPWVHIHRRRTTGDETNQTQDERVMQLGQIDDSYRMRTLAVADAALQTVLDAGRFVRERTQVFTFVYHFDSVESWLAYMAEHWSSAHVSADVIARARNELSAQTDEIRVLRTIQAARLRRQ